MPLSSPRQRTDPQKSLVGFVVGGVHYAVSIGSVREIVNPLEITELPHTPPEIAGVADHRGEVVPILDLRVRFGLERAEATRATKWILLDAETVTVGLIVDSVTEVFGTGGEELRPPPEVGGARDLRGILGVAKHTGRLTFVLDVERFVEIAARLAESGVLG